MRWGRAPRNPLWMCVHLEPGALGSGRVSPWCLCLFQVFYSEVGVDKSPQERSHSVPLSRDTAATVSTSILAAHQNTPVAGISAVFGTPKLACACCCVCNHSLCCRVLGNLQMSFMCIITLSRTSVSAESQPYKRVLASIRPSWTQPTLAAVLSFFFFFIKFNSNFFEIPIKLYKEI